MRGLLVIFAHIGAFWVAYQVCKGLLARFRLRRTNNRVYARLQELERTMETLSGVSSVARGKES